MASEEWRIPRSTSPFKRVLPHEVEGVRAAVLQVIEHLVVAPVPEGGRLPHFVRAQMLLEEAGWGLDELIAALEPGPQREALFAALGLS